MSNIFIVGYPKSGNTWLSRLVGDTLNCPIRSGLKDPSLADEGADRPGKHVVRQRHLWHPIDGTVIIISRDPRDILVSIMHYWQYDKLEDSFFRNGTKTNPLGEEYSISEFLDCWFSRYKKYVNAFTTYEALLNNTEKELIRILQVADIDFSKGRVDGVVRRQSFNKRRRSIKKGDSNALPYGSTIQLRNMRKGNVGDWKNHFKRKHGKIVHEHLWDWLHKLGYEKDKSWWESLPE